MKTRTRQDFGNSGNWYRYKVKIATPKWLTKEQHREIHQLYSEAKGLTRISSETQGHARIVYSVDHILPLRGDNVCGLHVPENLRIIPKVQNNKRHHYPELPLTIVRLDRKLRQAIAA